METLVRSSGAQANQPAGVGFSAGTLMLCVLMLLVLIACALTLFKIYMAIRGGKIAQGWLWLVVGFGLLGLAQLVLIAAQVSILPISQLWVDTLRAGALIVLLIGASRLRKLLT
jgi:hypothetical protein